MKTTIGIGCGLIVLLFIVGIAIWTLVVMGLWNFLLAPVFHLGNIDWPQGFAIAVVLAIIESSLASARSN